MDIQQRASHDIQPLIEQRADPFIYRHSDGYYYFVASVPEYDRIEIRRAQNLRVIGYSSLTRLAQPISIIAWAYLKPM